MHNLHLSSQERCDKVYDFIVQYKLKHDGCAPSYEQIRVGVGYNTNSSIHRILRELADQRRIRIGSNRESRTIEVVDALWVPPEISNLA